MDGQIPEAAEPVQAAVVQALARAFSWAEILECGQVKSISELACNLEVDGSYVTRILKLTTLIERNICHLRINVRCIGERKKSPCRPAARRANAEQKNFVAFHDEPIGCRFILLQSAAGELKGAVALPAVEMVVMPPFGSFIQRPEQWMDDPFQPPVINEKLEVPVDRCLVERVHALAAVCKHLVHPQRPFVLPEDLLYGHSLGCVAPQCLNLLFLRV
jgi:hypothetical protein